MDNETRVFASLIVASRRRLQSISMPSPPDGDIWAKHFEKCYSISNEFFYNKFYKRDITVKYLGGCQEKVQLPSSPPFNIRTDFVLLSQTHPMINAVHLHVSFPEITIDMNDAKDPGISSIITVLDSLYRFNEESVTAICPGVLNLLRAAFPADREQRDFALELSRYIYLSIAGLPEAAIVNHTDDNLINMYRFLYIHDQGVNAEVAREHLAGHWSSTSFFKLYCQPGALMSLSTPYPAPVYKDNHRWFFPDHITLAPPPREELSYDYLPEYPPLRYLAIPALHYAAVHEESLRYSFNALLSRFGSSRKRLSLKELFKSIQSSILAQNIEAVRLPITRSLISQIIQTQYQTSTIETVERVINRTMTSIQTAIALLALALSILSLCIAVWRLN